MKISSYLFSGIWAVPLLFLAIMLSIFPSDVHAEWVIERIDSKKNVGKYSSIAVDNDNRVHISYFSEEKGDLKYAKKDVNSPWVTATIDKRADAGLYTSIDVNKHVHISYYNSSNTKLRYANNLTADSKTNEKHTWQAQDIDVAHDIGQFTALTVDNNENTHISYYDSYETSLKYATNASGNWQVTTIDANGDVGQRSAIGIDSKGRIHISYYDMTNKALKYAVKDTNSWQVSILDPSWDVGLFSALAIDSMNGVHVAYVDAGSATLKYAQKSEIGTWSITMVDSSGAVGGHVDLSVDEKSKAHISYYENANGDLKYVTNKSGTWSIETVDSIDDVGQFSSIAVGSDHSVYISYYDYTQKDLKYAVKKSPISSASPSSAVFDDTIVGYQSDPQTITITNKGLGDLEIWDIAVAGTDPEDYLIAGETCLNQEIPFQNSCTIEIAFAPITAGDKSAILEISSNDPETSLLAIPLNSTATGVFTLSVIAGPGGTIEPSGNITVYHGASQNLTMVPNEGFYVSDVIVDGVSVGALTRYDFLDIIDNHTIEVSFASSVRIMADSPVYYPSFSEAYLAIPEGGTIQYQAVNFTGNLNLNRPVSVYLQGGYNFDYTASDSFTRVDGAVFIEEGTLTVENLEIQ